jgi:hypothetical protein
VNVIPLTTGPDHVRVLVHRERDLVLGEDGAGDVGRREVGDVRGQVDGRDVREPAPDRPALRSGTACAAAEHGLADHVVVFQPGEQLSGGGLGQPDR